MKIAISAESTIDLTSELLEKYNIHTTPFGVLLGDDLFMDGEIPTSKIFEYVQKTKDQITVKVNTEKIGTQKALQELTKLYITDIEFDDLKNMGDMTGYDFSIIKLKAFLGDKNAQTDLYIKMIRKDRIKESIFCYWSLLYDEKFKNYEESEFNSVINKVKITETESEEYKHSVLLEIKENNLDEAF